MYNEYIYIFEIKTEQNEKFFKIKLLTEFKLCCLYINSY